MPSFRQYDFGKAIRVTIKDQNGDAVDISDATSIKLACVKPDASVAEFTASFVTDGTDGKVAYIWVDEDLDQVGVWAYQVVVIKDVYELYSDSGTFRVERILKRY